MNGEREINIFEMLLVACLKWRRIVLLGVIVAVLAGGVAAFKYVKSINNANLTPEQNTTKTTADGAAIDENQLREEIKNTERALSDQQEYNDNSWMMEIDPKNQWMGLLTIYIKLENQSTDATVKNDSAGLRICSAYAEYVASDAFYDSVITDNNLEFSKIKYLRELVSINVSSNAYAINMLVTADTRENCETLLRLLEKAVWNKYESIDSAVDAHTLVASETSLYSVANLDLERTQEDNIQKVSTLSAQLEALRNTLEALNKPNVVAPAPSKITASDLVRKAAKSAVIGGIAAILVLGMYYCAIYVFSTCVYGEEIFDNRICTIGELPESGKRDAKGIDALIMKLFAVKIRRNEYEERIKVVALHASKLAAETGIMVNDKSDNDSEYKGICGNGKIALVSDMPTEELDALAKSMLDTNDKIYAAGNILSDYQAALESTEASSVIVVVKCGQSRRDNIRQMIAQLEDRKANVLGVLFTDAIAR